MSDVKQTKGTEKKKDKFSILDLKYGSIDAIGADNNHFRR